MKFVVLGKVRQKVVVLLGIRIIIGSISTVKNSRSHFMKSYDQYKRFIRLLAAVSILALEISMYSWAWIYYLSHEAGSPFFKKGDWLMIAVYGILLLFFSKMYGGLRIGYLEKGNVMYSQILSVTFVNTITYLQIALLAKRFLSLNSFLLLYVCDIVAICIWTLLANYMFQKLFPPRRMLLIYGNRPSLTLMDKMSVRKDRYEICEVIHIDIGFDELQKKIVQYEGVIICDVPSPVRNTILKYCYSKSIRVYLTPKISDILTRSAEEINLFDTPLLLIRNGTMNIEQCFLKRLMDIILSMLALAVTAPIMLITAIAIKYCDNGPVIYKQKRLTANGKKFDIYKFRSMYIDAEKDGVARLAQEGDCRITPVGEFIRKVRIDELPQLINILKGDMSIVGPRPERPEIALRYKDEMPEFDYRLKMKAGLTGYAQIYGKYNTTPYDKLKLDLNYIQNYSLMLDVKLIILTVKILFMKESTEGIAKEQSTAKLIRSNEKAHEKVEG